VKEKDAKYVKAPDIMAGLAYLKYCRYRKNQSNDRKYDVLAIKRCAQEEGMEHYWIVVLKKLN